MKNNYATETGRTNMILRDYLLDNIVSGSKRGIKETNEDVYGVKVQYRSFNIVNGTTKSREYKLDNLYVPIKIQIPFPLNQVDNICEQLIQQLIAKEDEFIKGYDPRFVVCHQLCDWMWLEDEEGKILHHYANDADNIYTATLVKYAKYLTKDGEEL